MYKTFAMLHIMSTGSCGTTEIVNWRHGATLVFICLNTPQKSGGALTFQDTNKLCLL